ncbi:MAG TPA: thioredoxin domain-containing protein [Chitinophagales bacterium]|jgi:thioredoxin-related protein|nr:thioredoxin domain-containing protein [Chitinophagales bacterium]HQW78998.1 thioredoxin domain-containing protein [Chitinophagales bacterium]HRB18936.1 thioredoxin domain-containing protein [Chitinophagales bacterium]HRB70086.1 thioredoxin domain-containing protein [Chitinophagales bacterium]
MKKIITNLAFLIFTATISAQESGMHFEQDATWQQILEKAKAENKFIFLDAYASWCGPCKWMAKEVFPKAEVGNALNPNYINAKIDMEKGEGIDLAKKYNVRNYPTYLFFNANGELIHRSLGSMPAKDFINLCNNTLKPEHQFITLKNKYLDGDRDTTFLRNYISIANYAQDSSAQTALKEFLSITKFELSTANIELIFNTTNSIHDTGYSIMHANKEKFISLLGKKIIETTEEDLVWVEAKNASKKGTDKLAFKKIIQKYLPNKTNLLCAEYDLSLLKRAQNWKAYLPKAIAFANTYCKNDADRLNYIAGNIWENYTNKTTLEKALQYALRSVLLNSNYDNNDTVARLYAKLNNKKMGLNYAETALALAKQADAETHSIEELIETLK